MSVLSPAALFWLLPIAAIIVGLYLLKMRRREMRVPASFLWPQQIEEIRANSLFQKLRFSWLLVLQLLAAALTCLALAQPQILSRGLTGRSTVIIVDSSLTMGASDVKPTRLEVAKSRAREIVNAAAPGEKVAIIDADQQPDVVSPLQESRSDQIRAINSIRQSDAPPTVGEALRIAAALVANNPSARIVLLSDDAFGSVTNFAPGKAKLAYECIGNGDDNLSISAFGASESGKGRQVYCAVHNSGSEPLGGVVNIFAGGAPIRSEKIQVAARGEWSASFDAPQSASILQAKLEAHDALESDNSISISTQKGSVIKVLLVTPEDPFTEKALALDPRVSLDRSNDVPQNELTPGSSRYDLIVFDGVEERAVSTPAVLVLGSSAASELSKEPQFQSQKADPILNAVDLSQVAISQSQKLDAGDNQVLASSSAGPLVLASTRSPRRIVLSFSPLKSDFPLQPSYPIFIANCLTFLQSGNDTAALVVRPGKPFSVVARKGADLTDADGVTKTETSKNGLVTFSGVPRTGRYRLKVDGAPRDLYCSLEPRQISIKPIANLTAGAADIHSEAAAFSAVDVWKYVAAVLLTLLLFEWVYYARKS